MTAPRQPSLALVYPAGHARDDFLVSDSNRAAWQAIHDFDRWPQRRLALSGPEGSGKTHLAAIWTAQTGGVRVPAVELRDGVLERLIAAPAVAVEDGHRIATLPPPVRRQTEAVFFHLLNLASAEGVPILVTGRSAPGRWPIETPDLASRLTAMAHVAIGPPDDALLSQVLVKLFRDRHQTVGDDVLEFLVRRMERSFAAAHAVVESLDRRALADRRRITRRFVAGVFLDEAGEPVHGED